MKAIVQERFGPPDVLQLVDTEVPEVGSDDVLVRVHAAAVNPYDWHIMRGDPLVARLMGGVGLSRPKARVAGVDAAGRVEAVGANVRGLRTREATRVATMLTSTTRPPASSVMYSCCRLIAPPRSGRCRGDSLP